MSNRNKNTNRNTMICKTNKKNSTVIYTKNGRFDLQSVMVVTKNENGRYRICTSNGVFLKVKNTSHKAVKKLCQKHLKKLVKGVWVNTKKLNNTLVIVADPKYITDAVGNAKVPKLQIEKVVKDDTHENTLDDNTIYDQFYR